jgi:hypothetical protein
MKTRKTHHKKPKSEVCSPSTRKNKFSCYSDTSLHTMKRFWNARHPDVKINSNDGREIWNHLRENLGSICNRESCWMRQKFMKGNLNVELKSYTFAPKAPASWEKKPNTWLTSVDIEKVMKQFEKSNSSFEFLGPSPIDFDTHKIYGDCVWEELCKFQLNDCLSRNKKNIGVVFNLDPHYEEGSHWVALFIDIDRKFIFYFDSTGDSTPKEIKRFINRVKKQGKVLDIKFENIYENDVEHQKEDTECGIYALYFIISMLKNKSPTDFLKKRITDNEMEKLRKIYFNT